ncbi:MAG: D-tyrosyl-tRNA(Tyr) deacylase [Candidatus Marinimicrobia bacterium]|nr:D-tyrosyl-tRNA(Tyr) deacylase [Candidatus Neomarinimicrobiota bacterium]
MIAVIQRTYSPAEVRVDHKTIGQISKGLVILLGVNKGDDEKDAQILADKIIHLRIFNDENEKMNISLKDLGGEALIISQFTLSGNCKKGRRPGFDNAEIPAKAEALYEYFQSLFQRQDIKTASGEFGAMMEVDFINSGPVTFVLDSKDLQTKT